MHPDEGTLRALIDRELSAQEISRLKMHMEGCPSCQDSLAALRDRAAITRDHLDAAFEAPAAWSPSARLARVRLEQRLIQKENQSMWQKLRTPRLRPALVALAMLAILFLALAFPPARAIANNFLGLFRVQQVAVVEFNPANLPEQLGSSNMFEQFIPESLEVEEAGEPQVPSDRQAASELAGRSIRLPENSPEELQLRVQPGTRVTFDVDLAKVRALLSELGYDHIELPEELDGEAVILDVPASVTAGYGPCIFEAGGDASKPDDLERQPPDCTVLIQMPSPTISAPPGLNLEEIGTAFLQVMGMSPEEAAKFSRSVDWATTLIVPIPRYSVEYQEVQVDGVQGILLQQDLERHVPNYMLLWVRDEVVYALTGVGDGAIEGIELANDLR